MPELLYSSKDNQQDDSDVRPTDWHGGILEQFFQEYVEGVGLTGCPIDQLRELQLAFFGGMIKMFCEMNRVALGDGPPKDATKFFDKMQSEFQSFTVAVASGGDYERLMALSSPGAESQEISQSGENHESEKGKAS